MDHQHVDDMWKQVEKPLKLGKAVENNELNMVPDELYIKEFDYNLPSSRIARQPLPERDSSRLLVYKQGSIKDRLFYELPEELPSGSLLILNDTRVIEARILFRKNTGGVIEIFCLEPSEESIETALVRTNTGRWNCLIGGASKWKKGQLLHKEIQVNGKPATLSARYAGKEEDHFHIEFTWTPGELRFGDILHAAGAIPLPPYMQREVTNEDSERYQTVFAEHEGSVAAPTASLHFTPRVFESLRQKNIDSARITLHVGAGTFQPVKSDKVSEHHMHREPFTITRNTLEKIIHAGTVITAGTTSLRTMESVYWLGVKLLKEGDEQWKLGQWEAYELEKKYPDVSSQESLATIRQWMANKEQPLIQCYTSLIIVPGYKFHLTQALITNFHQPQSTLLLLVSAFIGPDWKKVYDHAMKHDYRFLSYGDSSLLMRDE